MGPRLVLGGQRWDSNLLRLRQVKSMRTRPRALKYWILSAPAPGFGFDAKAEAPGSKSSNLIPKPWTLKPLARNPRTLSLNPGPGIKFDFDVKTDWQPVNSQRMLLWAGKFGKQEEFMTVSSGFRGLGLRV